MDRRLVESKWVSYDVGGRNVENSQQTQDFHIMDLVTVSNKLVALPFSIIPRTLSVMIRECICRGSLESHG